MPSWKKVITSGSNANLAQISASVVPTATTQNLLAIDSSTGGIMQITQSGASGINTFANTGVRVGNSIVDGNLGIGPISLGTSFAQNELHISSSGNTFIEVETSNSESRAGIRFDALRPEAGMGGNELYKKGYIQYWDLDEGIEWHSNGRQTMAAENSGIKFFSSSAANAIQTEFARFDILTKRLGIGTTSPGEKLEVDGNIKLSGNLNVGGYIHPNDENGNLSIYGGNDTTNDAQILLHGNSNYWGSLELNYGYDATNSFLKISQGSSEALRITNGGKVGIGTTSPSYMLDVSGSARLGGNESTTTLHIQSTGSFGLPAVASQIQMLGYESRGQGIFFKDRDNPNKEWFAGVPYQNSNLTRFQIGYSSNADGQAEYVASASLTIRNSGKVGIGTADPKSRLHIAAPAGEATSLTIEGDVGHSKNIFFNSSSNGYEAKIREHAGTLGFFTGGDMTDARMRIMSESGNVGIGTTSPTYKLHVSSSAEIVAKFVSSDNKAAIQIKDNDTTGYVSAENGRIAIGANAGTHVDNINIYNSKVGIGTTSPGEKLSVAGSISASGAITASNIQVDNDIALGGNIFSFSGFSFIEGVSANFSGSNKFGSGSSPGANDIAGGGIAHQFTGSVAITGSSLTLSNNLNVGNDILPISNVTSNLGSSTNYFLETNTYVVRSGGELQLKTNGDNEKVRITAAGDVGIGTTAPASALHISGTAPSVRIEGDAQSEINLKTNTNDKSNYIVGLSNGSISLRPDANNDAFNILSSGNVGIGTASPAQKLHVEGDSVFHGDIQVSGSEANIKFNRPNGSLVGGIGWDNNEAFYVGGHPDYGPAAGNLVRVYGFGSDLRLGNSGSGDVLTIDGANVGIGTNTPGEKLHVVGNITSSGKITVGADGNGSDLKVFGEKANTFMQYDASEEQLTIKHPRDQAGLTVFTTSSGTPTGGGQIRVGRDGGQYIGLKTLDRDAHFIHRQDETNGGQARTYFEIWDSNHPVSGSHNWAFRSADGDGGNLATRMLISSSGNVGIGTTEPYHTLHVTGSARVQGQLMVGDSNADNSPAAPLHIKNSGTATLRIEDKDGINSIYDITVNSGSGFSIKEDADTRLFIEEGGNVGIGTTSPSTKLQIDNGGSGTVDSAYSLAIRGDGIDGIHILSSNAHEGRIVFGDADDNDRGQIKYDHATDSMKFKVNASDAMIITGSNGNVGIGTNSPAAKLHSLGSGTLGWNAANVGNASLLLGSETYGIAMDSNEIMAIGSSLYLGTTTAEQNVLIRAGGSTTCIYVDGTTQNVGIGTSSPSAKLDVEGRVDFANDLRLRGTDSAADQGVARFYVDNTNKLAIDTANDGANIFVIDGSGNVGIGTTSPVAKLHVDSNTAFSLTAGSGDTLFLTDNSVSSAVGAVGASIGFGNAHHDERSAAIASLRTGGDHDNIGLAFYTHPSNSDNETIVQQMIIDHSGNVGIGTETPGEKLTVNSGYISVTGSGASGYGYELARNGLDTYRIQHLDGGLTIFNQTDTRKEMTFDGAGNVGIGTASPTEKLQVEGNISASGEVNINAADALFSSALTVNGDAYTTAGWKLGSSATFVGKAYNSGGKYSIETDTNRDIQFGDAETPAVMFIDTSEENVGIGTTTPTASLDVVGDIRVLSASLSYQENTDIDSTTATVATLATGSYDAGFFDYVAKNGTNLRAGIVTAIHSASIVQYNEVSTVDIGDTSDVKLSVVETGGNLALQATTTTDNWNIKSLVRGL